MIIDSKESLRITVQRHLKHFAKHFNADNSRFHIASKKDNRFYYTINLDDPGQVKRYLSPGNYGPAYRILKSKQPSFAPNAISSYEMRGKYTLQEGIKSAAAIPYHSKTTQYQSILFINFKEQNDFLPDLRNRIITETMEFQEEIEMSISPDLMVNLFLYPMNTKVHYEIQTALENFSKALPFPITIWERNEMEKFALAAFINCDGNVNRYLYGMDVNRALEKSVVNAVYVEREQNIISNPLPQNRNKKGQEYFIPYLLRDKFVMTVNYPNAKVTDDNRSALNSVTDQIKIVLELTSKNKALEDLSRIGNALNTEIDSVADFLNHSFESMARILDADEIVFHRCKKDSKEFQPITNSITYPKTLKKKLHAPRIDGYSERIINEGLIAVSDITKHFSPEFLNETVQERNYRSFIGLRIKAGEKVLGILFVNFHIKKEITTEAMYYSLLYADFFASLLNTKMLLHELETSKKENEIEFNRLTARYDELKNSMDIILDIPMNLGTQDYDIVFSHQIDNFANQIKAILKATSTSIIEYDQDYNEFFLRDTIASEAQRYEGFDSSKEIIARENIILEEDTEHPKTLTFRENSFTQRNKIKSLIAAPILFEKVPIGILWVDYEKKHVFTDEEITIVENFRKLLAVSLYTFGIINKLKVNLNVINRCLKVVEMSKSLQDLLRKLISFIVSYQQGTDAGVICLFEERTGQVMIYEVISPNNNGGDNIKFEITSEQYNFCRDRFITKNEKFLYFPTTVGSSTQNNEDFEKPIFANSKSKFIAPIKSNGNLMGLIIIESIQKEFLTVPDRRLLLALSDNVAIMIQDKHRLNERYSGLFQSELVDVIGNLQAALLHRFNNNLGLAKSKLDVIRSLLSDNDEGVKDKLKENVELTKYVIEKGMNVLDRIFLPSDEVKQVFDIDEIINETINTFDMEMKQPLYKTSGDLYPKPSFTPNHTHGRVFIHKSWLIMHLNEILLNAHKAINNHRRSLSYPSEYHIIISTRNDDENIFVEITNNGGAIPRNKWEEIFEEGGKKSDNNGKSTSLGMGLFLAKRYMLMVQGEIRVKDSLFVNETTFEIRLKLYKQEEAA